MNTFTRMIGLFMALLMICTAVLACGVTTVPPSAEPTFSITEEFVITRPIRGTDAELTCARAIRDALSAMGLTVRVQEDFYADVDDIPKCEILVGATNREESKTVTDRLDDADWANNVKTHAVPLITEVAEAKECYLIDIYSWSRKNISVFTDNGGDGLHPKNENYEKLAQAVYNGLKDTIRKP